MKILVSKDYGGYSFSQKAIDYLKNTYDIDNSVVYSIRRNDPRIINTYFELGEEMNGTYSTLQIVEVPPAITDWIVEEYDGWEFVYYVLDGRIHKI